MNNGHMVFVVGILLWPLRASPELADRSITTALRQGFSYMVQSATQPDHFEEFASDYLFFFADIARVADPWMQERATQVGRALGKVYLSEYFYLDSADEVVDAAASLYALDSLGLDVLPALVLLKQAAVDFEVADYLGFDPVLGEVPNVDQLSDLLIGLHFTERLQLDLGITFAEVLPYVASVDYRVEPFEDFCHFIDLNNLITHLIYTLSGYASWNLTPWLVAREIRYLRRHFDTVLSWADPETLSEFIDCYKICGLGENDAQVAQGVRVLLALQKVEDGRWEPQTVEDEYDRYHATWCAMDALRAYHLDSHDETRFAFVRNSEPMGRVVSARIVPVSSVADFDVQRGKRIV